MVVCTPWNQKRHLELRGGRCERTKSGEKSMKEGSDKPRGARTADKAGWIKKSSGGLLSLWKDRYLLLCQAQLLVYENEDEQKCVETVELGSYEKCQDLRAVLKRKHRFILLRSPGNKVSDIKFQAPSGEEKESWIKALNEGINRGKNKAFDEVKVDKTCALEHVTRNRVRGGQRRRPPTRIHLKEVASAASDGLLRLDLDVPDSGPPVFAPVNDVSETQPQEPPRVLMPPVKPSPVPETCSTDDSMETPAGERGPTPVSASPEAKPESQEDAETPAEGDSDFKRHPNSTWFERLKPGCGAAEAGHPGSAGNEGFGRAEPRNAWASAETEGAGDPLQEKCTLGLPSPRHKLSIPKALPSLCTIGDIKFGQDLKLLMSFLPYPG
ncbi:pleckstrin homology domain-containing family O member 2 [Cricetulus griseus]|nr:pleckstrin homology domain-containing family O member 2 [Cricetulus griseus]